MPGDNKPPVTVASLSGPSGGSGWYTGPVTVTLTATDDSGVASTSYWVDGGPKQNYTGPFDVAGDGNHTVQFSSTDKLGNVEPPKSVTFGIDTVAPSVMLTLDGTPGSSGWFVSEVTVTLSASDATSGVSAIQYKVNLGVWTTYSSPFGLSDGVYALYYYAVDVAGQTSATRFSSIQVDEHSPISTVSFSGSSGNGGWYNSPVTVTLASTDYPSGVASLSYRVDEGPWQNYAGPFTIATEGTHYVAVSGTDVAGNIEPASSHAVGVDATAPTTSLSLRGVVGSNGWYTSGVQVTLNASDGGSGVAITTYRLNVDAWQTYTGPFMVWDGIKSLAYFSADRAGNLESTSSATIRVDTTPPTSSAAISGSQGAGGWWATSVVVVLSAADETSGVSGLFYRIDGGPWRAYSGALAVTGQGPHLIEHYATDLAGNAEDIQATPVDIDTTLPLSTASLNGTVGPSGWYVSNVTVQLAAQDLPSGVQTIAFRLDGGPWQDYASPFLVQDGRHVLEYQAIDRAGNTEASHTVSFNVDSTPPVFRDLSPGGVVQSSTLVISWNATDATSGIDRYLIRIDDGAFFPTGTVTRYPVSLSDGTHEIRVQVTDRAGNVATSITTLRVDTNFFSLTGPNEGTPTYIILVAGIVVGLILTWRLGDRKESGTRPD